MNEGHPARAHSPGDHDAGDPDAGAPPFRDKCSRNLTQHITKEKDSGAYAKNLRREAKICIHGERCIGNIDAVEIGNNRSDKRGKYDMEVLSFDKTSGYSDTVTHKYTIQ